MYVCMYVCACAFTCVYVYVYVHVHLHVYVYAYVYVYVYLSLALKNTANQRPGLPLHILRYATGSIPLSFPVITCVQLLRTITNISDHVRKFPEDFQRFSENLNLKITFEPFPKFFEDFQRFPKTSEDFKKS